MNQQEDVAPTGLGIFWSWVSTYMPALTGLRGLEIKVNKTKK
jgi:hypothetical protein